MYQSPLLLFKQPPPTPPLTKLLHTTPTRKTQLPHTDPSTTTNPPIATDYTAAGMRAKQDFNSSTHVRTRTPPTLTGLCIKPRTVERAQGVNALTYTVPRGRVLLELEVHRRNSEVVQKYCGSRYRQQKHPSVRAPRE